jgi:hypothetical protein
MFGLDTEIGASALRLWVAAGSAALLIGLCVLAFLRPRIVAGRALRACFLMLGAVLGAAMTWMLLGQAALNDRGTERRSFELRAEHLNAQALAPGSALGCLDGLAGETVEAACEKALFASPATVASASSYVAERFTLLAGMAAHAEGGGADIDFMLLPLRRSLEADRFGFLAHVLAIRDGCTSQNCKALAVLHDSSRVRANLSAGTLDHYLDHYLETWAKASEGTAGDGAQPGAQSSAQAPHKMVNIDFPTAASIPPVSIMNPEPTGPVLPGVAAAAASNPNPQQTAAPTSRHSRKQAANPSPQPVAQPVASGAAAESIWPQPVPPPPPQTGAAPAGAPVQLNPPSPSASASATARTQ